MLSRFSYDYEVCSCSHVKLSELVFFVKENNTSTLGHIQDFLKIGSGCKYCICEESDFGIIKKKIYCKDILNYVKNNGKVL